MRKILIAYIWLDCLTSPGFSSTTSTLQECCRIVIHMLFEGQEQTVRVQLQLSEKDKVSLYNLGTGVVALKRLLYSHEGKRNCTLFNNISAGDGVYIHRAALWCSVTAGKRQPNNRSGVITFTQSDWMGAMKQVTRAPVSKETQPVFNTATKPS